MSLSVTGGLGTILSTFFELYGAEGYGIQTILLLATLPALMTGIGNYIFMPYALAFGRRPAFMVAYLILLFSTIGAAAAQNFPGHLAARVLQGLACGAAESLLPLMLTEITFMHQRALVFGGYWATQTALSSVVQLGSSYETAALGWRWYYGVFSIFVGVGLIMAFFFGFETRYSRPAASIDGQVIITDEFGVTRVLSDEEAAIYLETTGEVNNQGNVNSGSRRSYMSTISLWPGRTPNSGRLILRSLKVAAECFTSPGIVFAILVPSITLGCAIALSLTYSTVLIQNYHWAPKSVGLISLSPIPAALLAMILAGFGGDKISIFMARRNSGVAIPEHRLIPLVFPLIAGVAGMLLYAFTADNKNGNGSWAGPIFGWGIYEFAFVCTLITSTAFAAECWPQNPGPALVVVIGTKNVIAFGITFALSPMVQQHGYRWAYGILSGVFVGIFLLGIPVYWGNQYWRKRMLKVQVKTTSSITG